MSVWYLKVKRDKIGQCNLCGNNGKLSWDHVPPKGGIELTPVEQHNIFNFLTGKKKEQKYILSQNGVKYRTLCSHCNNDILGAKYDPVLNSFALGVGSFLNTKLKLPSIIKFRTKPNMLVRSVLGHLIAAKAEIENTKMDEIYRSIVLNDSIVPPKDVKIYYWIYPYSEIVIMRDFAMPSVRGNFKEEIGFFSLLKYFPVAYLVSNVQSYEGLAELTKFCTSNINDDVEIPINLLNVQSEYWPEYGEDSFLLGGQSLQSAIRAVPKKKNS